MAVRCLHRSGLIAKQVKRGPLILTNAVDPLPRFDISDQAVLMMDDTTPTDLTTGGVASGNVKSLWQSRLIALRAILQISWGLRAPGGLAWLENVLW